jgi:hypothetical protein
VDEAVCAAAIRALTREIVQWFVDEVAEDLECRTEVEYAFSSRELRASHRARGNRKESRSNSFCSWPSVLCLRVRPFSAGPSRFP